MSDQPRYRVGQTLVYNTTREGTCVPAGSTVVVARVVDHGPDEALMGRDRYTYVVGVPGCENLRQGAVAAELEAPSVPARMFPTSSNVTAREAVPGTRIVVRVQGTGWKLATVREWRALGNGYAELLSTDGFHCGQYEADHLFELVPPGN